MAVPARPVAGAPIETGWGQVAHDEVVKNEIKVGRTSVPQSGAKTATVAVVFNPVFASNPYVIATAEGTGGSYFALVSGISPSGFTIVVTHKMDTNVVNDVLVQWMAYGARS